MTIIVKEYATIAEAKATTDFETNDIVHTLGFWVDGKGAGFYQVTNVDPGYLGNINHVTQTMVNTAPLYLKLLHEGTIGIEQAGAKGNDSNNDTDAIQACLNLLIDGAASHITAGKGIFRFTSIKFYNPAQFGGLRGNFRFTGAGCTNPKRLRAGSFKGGTVFRCTDTGGSFDINTASIITGAPDKLDTGSSMSAVDIGYFSVIGAVTGVNKLISTDFIVGQSSIHNISVVNEGNGIAWYARSNATTIFSSIEGLGKNSSPRVGSGFYYDTDLGVGAMVTLEDVAFSEFNDGIYIGHTDAAADTFGGFSNSVLRAVNGFQCTNNFHFRKLASDIENVGNCAIYMETCVSELIEAGGAGVFLENDASLVAVNTTFGGSSASGTQEIKIDNSAATSIDHAGKIMLDGCRVTVNANMTAFCVVPNNSYYSIHTKNTTGRTYNKQIFSLPSVFKGVFLSQDDAIEGMAVTQTLLMDKLQYLHPASRIRNMNALSLVPGTQLDLSNRPYLPQTITLAYASGTPASTINVPNSVSAPQQNQHSRCTIKKLGGTTTLKMASTTANLKINNSALTTEITITAANYFYEVTSVYTKDGLFYQVTSADTTATVL